MTLAALLGVGAACIARSEAQQVPTPAAAIVASESTAPSEPPLELAAAKARAVLDVHCARCHQSNKMANAAPAGGIGNILDLAALAREPHLVVPGNPDASRLYTSMLAREMPSDIAREGAKAEEPTPIEIEVVRDWIAGLDASDASRTCSGRKRIAPQEAGDAMRRAVASDPATTQNVRFVTLTHLYNSCASEPELAAFRQAIAKLLNSLSWASDPARIDPVNEAGTILKVRLSDFGWVAAHWEKIAQAYPYAQADGLDAPPDLSYVLGTRRASLPGDWLAWAASQPPIYYDLLGLPERRSDLERILSVDIAANERSGKLRRISLRRSNLTRGPRMIEQHVRGSGSVWLAYDFAGTDGRRDIFANPVGPQSPQEPNGFKPDGQRLIFNLGNNMPAFAVFDGDGRRVNAVPPEIVAATSRTGPAREVAGLSCLSCHSSGPRRAQDELRSHLQSPAGMAVPRPVRDAMLQVHVPEAEMSEVLDEAGYENRRALIRSGVDPDLSLGGLEIVAALARPHTRSLSLARAAAELGIDPDTLRRRLMQLTPAAAPMARALVHGPIARADMSRLMVILEGVQAADSVSPEQPPAAGKPELLLFAERATHKIGDLAVFGARASADCNLTLISVNPGGKATVIFPNDFEPDNRIMAGRTIAVPGEKSPYQLRFKQAGTETLVGVCTTQSKLADGIVADYGMQRFTALGDWRNFLRTVGEDDAADRRNPDQAEARQRARGRNARKEPTEPKLRPEPQARTAIQIRVE